MIKFSKVGNIEFLIVTSGRRRAAIQLNQILNIDFSREVRWEMNGQTTFFLPDEIVKNTHRNEFIAKITLINGCCILPIEEEAHELYAMIIKNGSSHEQSGSSISTKKEPEESGWTS